VEKSFGLSHLAWKSRKRRGIPTLSTATATANVYDASGKMNVVDQKERLTPDSNRLIFIAPDHASLTRVRDCIRTAVEVNPATAKLRLVQLAEEIIGNLASDPQAELTITVEINAGFPNGASDQIKRAVSENAKSLGFKTWTWE
jgi:hypothetical protein